MMKKITYFMIILLSITSCKLAEKFEKLNKLEKELQQEFNHPNISISYSFGTEENDNFYQITFYEYDMADKTHSELKSKANLVNSYFDRKISNKADIDFKEVRYTESDSDDAISFVSFKFD